MLKSIGSVLPDSSEIDYIFYSSHFPSNSLIAMEYSVFSEANQWI